MDNIFRDLAAVRREGERALLATVVRTYGSAYRREGAGAVLTPDGVAAGAISGGCLESDLLEATRQALDGAGPRLMDYDTSLDEEDLIWGTGTGCGGRVQVLLAEVPADVLELLDAELSAGRPAALATVVGGTGLGRRLAVARDGRVAGSLGRTDLDARLGEGARTYLAQGRRDPIIWAIGPDGALLGTAAPREVLPVLPEGSIEVFVQMAWPPPILLVLGAGDDAIPLARFGAQTGFRVVVADHRPAYLTADRFPGARLVLCQPEELLGQVEVGPDTYAVLMTHNYQKDHHQLKVLLSQPVAYIGLLGARERSRRLVEAVRGEIAGRLPDTVWERVYTPVGLDIGADGPAEIAISILAEILAVRSGRPGVPLRQSRPIVEV